MLVGIDVGGTHTDAVAVKNGKVVASGKVATQHDDLLSSVMGALDIVCSAVEPKDVERLNLSTTLSTNAIVEGRTDAVSVIVSSGPGIDPSNYQTGAHYYPVSGSIDHRGEEISPVVTDEVAQAVETSVAAGINAFAAVSKFSTRNPEHELQIAKQIGAQADVVSLGHRFSGQLDFPRRIATAYYNAAVWALYNRFADAVEQGVRAKGITAPVQMLKADGGTMPLATSREFPVESILSGPAASVMGVLAQTSIQRDADSTSSDMPYAQQDDTILLDIGGTTTDIAIIAGGTPLVEKNGIAVGSFPTLVRALKTLSIGLGGDSALQYTAGMLRVGPERKGPCMAVGGEHPTLMDALLCAGYAEYGDKQKSLVGIQTFAAEHDLAPDAVISSAITTAVATIVEQIQSVVDEVNSTPVYTIREIVRGEAYVPQSVSIMGGPAKAFVPLLEEALDIIVQLVPEYSVANAIGAAMTKPTFELELFADTEAGTMIIPVLGERKEVRSRYTLLDGVLDAKDGIMRHFEAQGLPLDADAIEVVEEQSFTMVGDYGAVGKNIRVKCQVMPSIGL